jgi:hypothetical protein
MDDLEKDAYEALIEKYKKNIEGIRDGFKLDNNSRSGTSDIRNFVRTCERVVIMADRIADCEKKLEIPDPLFAPKPIGSKSVSEQQSSAQQAGAFR